MSVAAMLGFPTVGQAIAIVASHLVNMGMGGILEIARDPDEPGVGQDHIKVQTMYRGSGQPGPTLEVRGEYDVREV